VHRLERAVAEAERAFDAVTPDHPRVKERLKDRYEDTLRCLAVLKADHARHPLPMPVEMGEREFRTIQDLLSDLPSLWRHPKITSTQRKALLRLVIQRINVRPDPHTWQVTIQWMGGGRSEVNLLAHAGARKLVWERHCEGLSPAQIAACLAEQDVRRLRGPHTDQPYDELSILDLLESIRTDYPDKKREWRRRTGRSLSSRHRV
jgi:hypothetical protein